MTDPSSTLSRYFRWLLLMSIGLVFSLGLHGLRNPDQVRAIDGVAIASNPDPRILEQPQDLNPEAIGVSHGQANAPTPSPHALVQSAKGLYDSQRYAEASQQLSQAAAAYGAIGDGPNQAQALSLQSLALQKLGDWTNAQAVLDQSFAVLDSVAKPPVRIRAQLFNAQGHLHLSTGQSQAAFNSWQNAERDYLAVDEVAGAMGSQINQIQALESIGSYRQAGQILDEVEAHLNQITDPRIKAKGHLKLGNMLRLRGELERSRNQLTMGVDLAQDLRPDLLNQLYINLGNTEHILVARAIALNSAATLPSDAQTYRRKALDYYQRAETAAVSPLNRAEAQLSQLRLLIQTRFSDAGTDQLLAPLIADLQSALPYLPSGRRAIYAQINMGHSLMQLMKQTPGQAKWMEGDMAPLLQQAIAQAEALQDERAIAHATGTLGHWYEIQREWTAARELTHTALQKSQAIQAADIAYQWQWQMGRILQGEADDSVNLYPPQSSLRKGEDRTSLLSKGALEGVSRLPAKADAIAYYSQSVDTLNSLRTDLVAINPDIQFSFREQVEPVYRELVGLLLRDPDADQGQLRQARDVIESLQLAELDNFFRDTCAKPQAVSIGEVDPTAAVFYPILLDDVPGQPSGSTSGQSGQRLEVIVQLPAQALSRQAPNVSAGLSTDDTILVHISQSFDHQDVTQVATALQNNLKRLSTPTSRIKAQSQQLYDWIIRPLEQALDYGSDRDSSPIKTLAFVLDGPLRNLPMSVLHDGDHYLVERYAIAFTPGLQLLDPQPLQRQALNVLLGGAENAPSFANVGLGPLANVGRELDEISITIPTTEALMDQVFLKNNIQNGLAQTPFNVVHFATHGKFSSDPEQTFILDWQQRISAQDMDILLRVNEPERAVKNPIELLVLSACETASGDSRATLGLAGIAIRAGTRSTLATLWQVNDASTTEFMVRFYKELTNPKVTKADALRNAQLSFLKDNPRTRHNRPNRWAPFTLVGNWL